MRLAVLDTNVLVSAGIKEGGAPFQIVYDWVLTGQIQIVLCPSVVAEYRDVLSRPKFSRYGFPPAWLEFLIEESVQLPDPESWKLPFPDPSDGIFLALAKRSGAWLISGNLKHFPAESRNGVTFCSPAEYLHTLQQQ